MEGRPNTTKTTRTTRETKFTMTKEQVNEAIVAHLKKIFPEFRGFEYDEFEIDWSGDGLSIHALKEDTSKW